MKRTIGLGAALALALALPLTSLRAQDRTPETKLDVEFLAARAREAAELKKEGAEKKFHDFNDLIKGSEKLDGLFTLHRKDEHLYAEIKPMQFDQPLLTPITIARGLASAGTPVNFGDEWVVVFKHVGDKVQLVRRNIHYRAPSGTPLEKAVKQNYTDSVLMALPVQSINPAGQAVVIDLADIFLTDFAELGLGALDRDRTTWHKVKAFPHNLELEVEATFARGLGGVGPMSFDDGVADHRGVTLVIHYSLVKLPEPGYKPRYADDRVGHFLSALKDFGSNDPDTTFVRQINRWRLEKSDPKAKLSPPRKQVIWYVEDTVPHEYRPFVEAGILEWNKAFEKVGFRNALAVRWQEAGRDEFDPEDINYCTFRWITSPGTYAMSCLRADPITGEMIDGDVIFDASWIRHWKNEYALLTGTGAPSGSQASASSPAPTRVLAVGEVISPILALKRGYGLPLSLPPRPEGDPARLGEGSLALVPAEWTGAQVVLRRRLASGQFAGCQLSTGLRPEFGLAAIALAAADKTDADGKVPQEFLGQAIKEVVMHEVGHSLGLRHNFKASTMLDAGQLNDTSITRAKGNTGSVMDYNPINLAPRGRTQGDYYTTTIGPYDYWAIEYAYRPIDGDEEKELRKIAARSPEPDLAYATDEDMFLDNDPLVNVYDLGADTFDFARDRMTLASELMKDLDAKMVKDGESWARLRVAFTILLNQWGNAAALVSSHIGGQHVARDHKGTKGARDPITPVSGAKQREALALLVDRILGDKAFRFSPGLLRKLASERWYHWGNESLFFLGGGGVEFPVNGRILAIQRIVLDQCFDPGVLTRLQDQEAQADPGAEPLKMAEVFRALTDGIWSECTGPAGDPADRTLACSTVRRNLQREHLRRLATMVLGERRNPYDGLYGFIFFNAAPLPADARSLARMHLKEIDARIAKVLEAKDLKIDDTTRAHLEECHARIGKVLAAALDANEP